MLSGRKTQLLSTISKREITLYLGTWGKYFPGNVQFLFFIYMFYKFPVHDFKGFLYENAGRKGSDMK